VWSARDRKPIRRTFATLKEAVAWRRQALADLHRGTLRGPSAETLAQAAHQWLQAAQQGAIRTRSGDPYKPSAIRTYHMALRAYILPRLGHHRLTAITHRHIQDLADDLVAKGAAPSTVRNAVLPLRAIYRREIHRETITQNPTRKLLLPAVRGTRDRVARPDEAAILIAALAAEDQAVWALALYAGLRRGELQALRWRDIDLDRGLIHIERSWDRVEGPIEPKSRSGKRRVPLTETLRKHLIHHRLTHPHTSPDDLALGRSPTQPFEPNGLHIRARAHWRQDSLTPIRLHECRHTYAAYMIAAGVNPKALQTYMGHASITITLDRYGHLLPGNETDAATLLDNYLTNFQPPHPPANQTGPLRPIEATSNLPPWTTSPPPSRALVGTSYRRRRAR
jgi:integrase